MAASESYTIIRAARNATLNKCVEDDATLHRETFQLSAELAAYLDQTPMRPLVRLLFFSIAAHSKRTGEPLAINTRLLDVTTGIGERGRREFRSIATDLHDRGLMTVDSWYQPNNRSMTYHVPSARHITMGDDLGDDLNLVIVVVDLSIVDHELGIGKKRLNWRAEEHVTGTLTHVALVHVPDDDADLRAIAEAEVAKKRTNKKNPSKKVDAHVRSIRSLQHAPSYKVSMRSGRMYHQVLSLPRWARERYVRLCGDVPDTVDIRCCYLWCVAANLRRKLARNGCDVTSVERLLSLIEDGEFYDRLAELAWKSKTNAKASFATLCLFGDEQEENWGRNRLWYALRKLCPEICCEISYLRKRFGRSGFAKYCMRWEAAIILHGLVLDLADDGVACIPLHDGALVPRGHRDRAAMYIRARSYELFGRECAVGG